MDTNAIVSAAVAALVDQITPLVTENVLARLKAEGMATLALEPDSLRTPLIALLDQDMQFREALRDMVCEGIDSYDFLNVSLISDMSEKIDAMDFESHDFSEAVKTAIRDAL